MKQTNLADIDAFFQKLCEENYADLGNFLLVLTKDREQAQDIYRRLAKAAETDFVPQSRRIFISDCAAVSEIFPSKTFPGTKSGRVS